jgi:hypothetical protein
MVPVLCSVKTASAPALRLHPQTEQENKYGADSLNNNSWARDFQGTLGIHEIGLYLQLWRAIEHTILTAEQDNLLWRWTANGKYTAKSCYIASF